MRQIYYLFWAFMYFTMIAVCFSYVIISIYRLTL